LRRRKSASSCRCGMRAVFACRQSSRDGTSLMTVSHCVVLAGCRGFLRRRRACRRRPRCRSLTPDPTPFARGGMAHAVAATRPALLPSAGLLVHGCPSSTFGLRLWNAAFLVALGDMIRHALLLVGVLRLISTRHYVTFRPCSPTANRRTVPTVPKHNARQRGIYRKSAARDWIVSPRAASIRPLLLPQARKRSHP